MCAPGTKKYQKNNNGNYLNEIGAQTHTRALAREYCELLGDA